MHAPRRKSVRLTLRNDTREAHERLESMEMFADFSSGQLDFNRYTAMMDRFHGFYVPLDEMITAAIATLGSMAPEFTYSRRSPLIKADLWHLHSIAGGGAADEAVCDALPTIESQAQLAGVLYVIEGSVLGGARLSSQAARILGSRGERGLTYWSWCRREGPARWTATVALLERSGAEESQVKVMSAAALETFDSLWNWFSTLEPNR